MHLMTSRYSVALNLFSLFFFCQFVYVRYHCGPPRNCACRSAEATRAGWASSGSYGGSSRSDGGSDENRRVECGRAGRPGPPSEASSACNKGRTRRQERRICYVLFHCRYDLVVLRHVSRGPRPCRTSPCPLSARRERRKR